MMGAGMGGGVVCHDFSREMKQVMEKSFVCDL